MIKLLSVLAVATALTACGGGGGGLDVAGASPAAAEATMSPMAATTTANGQATVSTTGGLSSFGQSPAYVRTRYGFDALTTPAQQGSGQTIVIISAYDNPNAGADLAAYSTAKGLPGCPTVSTTYTTNANGYTQAVVPKPAAGDGCTFQKFNANPNGLGANPNVIQYDASGAWIAESNMDIQWAHAMAPMAKIVLVQGSNNFITSLSGAVKVASGFADVISMSWGGYENALTQVACTVTDLTYYPDCNITNKTQRSLYGPVNPVINGVTLYGGGGWDTGMFANPNVTYIAASGDGGANPLWPAVSNKVLAVGGTNDAGTVDTAWSYSGGGVSKYYSSPSWQSVSGNTQRTTPDVAMPADSASPMSIYISPQTAMKDANCVTAKGAAACGWYAGYGTSVSAPMWAGLAAVTKAVRAQNGKPVVDFIASLYSVAAVQGNYVTAFTDVTTGSSSASTPAKVGYDLVTGLGVPKASALVGLLAAQ